MCNLTLVTDRYLHSVGIKEIKVLMLKGTTEKKKNPNELTIQHLLLTARVPCCTRTADSTSLSSMHGSRGKLQQTTSPAPTPTPISYGKGQEILSSSIAINYVHLFSFII